MEFNRDLYLQKLISASKNVSIRQRLPERINRRSHPLLIPVTRVTGMIVFTPPRSDGVYFGNPSRKNWKSPI